MGFARFQAIETSARESAEAISAEYKKAHQKGTEITAILDRLTAERAAEDPVGAWKAVQTVSENGQSALIEQAIERALGLQMRGKKGQLGDTHLSGS